MAVYLEASLAVYLEHRIVSTILMYDFLQVLRDSSGVHLGATFGQMQGDMSFGHFGVFVAFRVFSF